MCQKGPVQQQKTETSTRACGAPVKSPGSNFFHKMVLKQKSSHQGLKSDKFYLYLLKLKDDDR